MYLRNGRSCLAYTPWNKVTADLRQPWRGAQEKRRHFCKWSALPAITDAGYISDGTADELPAEC